MLPFLIPLLALGLQYVYGKDASPSALKPLTYTPGDNIPLSCLSRTIDTGEHIQDSKTGALQYIPFGVCNETSAPLSLNYLDERELNCTIADLSDEMYHLLEFYIHQDSPLACRVPARPLGGDRVIEHEKTGEKEKGMEGGEEWVPLLIALSGSLESSHLHISTILNLLFHTSPADNTINSATAYSISPLAQATRIIIGDPLALTFRVRWYSGTDLPSSTSSFTSSHYGAGHTIFYCLISAGIGAGVMYAWAVGVAMPRRLKRVTMAMRGRDVGGIITGDVGGKGRGYGYGGYANGGGNGTTTEVKGYGGYGFGGGNGKRKD